MAEALLPPNATGAETALAETVAAPIDATPVAIRDLRVPARCPAALLAELAWELSVDVWDPAWPEARKREVIAESIAVHRVKGTVGSVRRAVAAAGLGEARVIEQISDQYYDGTYRYDGAITHAAEKHWAEYRVKLARPLSVAQAGRVRALLAAVAPARCRLDALDFTAAANLYDGPIRYDGAYTHGVT